MFGYFITAIAVIFWIFRVIVAVMFTTQTAFAITPLNMTFEIIILFVTLPCIILTGKRKMLGAVGYLIAHIAYFGAYAYNTLQVIIEGEPQTYSVISLFISIIAIIIPILAIMDIGLNTGKKGSIRNKKTDWFYGTTEYEREIDERADKNQYKF